MPGRAHDMGTQDGSVVECLLNVIVYHAIQAQAQRPFRGCEVLRLRGPQPFYQRLRRLNLSPCDMLVMQSPPRNLQVDHCLPVSSAVFPVIITRNEGRIIPPFAGRAAVCAILIGNEGMLSLQDEAAPCCRYCSFTFIIGAYEIP